MSITTIEVDELFTVRTIKYLSANPERKWANSYEFQAGTAGAGIDLVNVALRMVNFEKEFHLNTVIFDRTIISSWAEDSSPYDPESFLSVASTAVGEIVPSEDPVALTTALSVARAVTGGRFGHIFYRGCLKESNVTAPAGKYILTNKAGIQTQIDDAVASSTIDDYVGAAPGSAFRMVMVNRAGTNIRAVTNLTVQGVSVISNDHAWYNRASP